MKNIFTILLVLFSVAFVNVGFACTNVITEKAETETEVKTLDEATVSIFGVYSIVKLHAPEVFTDNAGGTSVILYGEFADEAFTYLTKHKDAKAIIVSKECYKDETIAISICRETADNIDRGHLPDSYRINDPTSNTDTI